MESDAYTIQEATVHILGLKNDLRLYTHVGIEFDLEASLTNNPYRLEKLKQEKYESMFFALCDDIPRAKKLYEKIKSSCFLDNENESVVFTIKQGDFETVSNPLGEKGIDEIRYPKSFYLRRFKFNCKGLDFPKWFDDISKESSDLAEHGEYKEVSSKKTERIESKERESESRLIFEKGKRYCPELACAIETWFSFESKPYDGNALSKEIRKRIESWNEKNHNVLTLNGIDRIVSLINWKSNENKRRQK